MLAHKSSTASTIPSAIELESFTRIELLEPSASVKRLSNAPETFEYDQEADHASLQDSRISTSIPLMTLSNPPRTKHRLLAAIVWEFTLGMSDSVVGALLPSIAKYYGISYAVVSLIWLGNALGFITIAFTGHYLDSYLGRRKTVCLSCLLMVVAFIILSSGVKVFPLIVIAYFICGLGGAIGASQFNLYLSKFQDSAKFLGAFHGFYGIGGFTAPLLGTLLVENQGYRTWHYFFLIPLVLQSCAFVAIAWSFQGSDEDLAEFYHTTEEMEQKKTYDFLATLKDMRCWLSCAFIFFYQGSEVSMGGWVVTFLLDYRGGPESTGYVASGFWAGVTVGRFALTHIMTKHLGIRRSVIVLAALIIALDILAWLIPNTIAAGTFASILGVFIGPIYPMMIALITQILPRKLRFNALTLATAFGSSGGSAIPFIIGLASEFVGTFVLHPIFLGCYACLSFVWILLPNIERKNGIKNLWQRLW